MGFSIITNTFIMVSDHLTPTSCLIVQWKNINIWTLEPVEDYDISLGVRFPICIKIGGNLDHFINDKLGVMTD